MYSHDPTIMMHPKIGNQLGMVTIEGNIGAGKTRALQELERMIPSHRDVKIIYVPEPSDVWMTDQRIPEEYRSSLPDGSDPDKGYRYLNLFYEDPSSHAFAFQVHAYCTRTSSIYERIREMISTDDRYILVTERSVLTDKDVFTKNLISEGKFPLEYVPIYDQFWCMVAGPLASRISSILYLDVSLETCVQRMKARNRDAESSVPIEYLKRLDTSHEDMLRNRADSISIHRLDWNPDLNKEEGPILNNLGGEFRKILDAIMDGKGVIKV